MNTPETRPEELRPYLDAGWDLIPLHRWDDSDQVKGKQRQRGKSPLHAKWLARPYKPAEQLGHMERGGNIGVRLRADQLVVDVDLRNFEDVWRSVDPFVELVLRSGMNPDDFPTVKTGGGGLHLYMTKPAGLSVRDSLPDFPGVEFKTLGRQVVAAGSLRPDSARNYAWDELGPDLASAPPAPAGLLAMIGREASPAAGPDAAAGIHPPEELATMLDRLDPVDFQDQGEWFTLMQACHHATAGAGREEFIAWSTRDPQYADHAGVIAPRWDSLHADGPGPRVTYRTLYKILRDAGHGDVIPAPSAADDFDDDAEDADEEPAADAVPGSSRSILSRWVFVADPMKFVRRGDLKQFKPDQWNSLYASLDPEHNLTSRVFKGKTPVKRYESIAYVPSAPEEIGRSTYNLWRPSAVASREGDASVMEEHLDYLFPEPAERGYVLDFMHLVCCHPEVKVMFAPLIQGKQGTGKTALGVLLKRIIGGANVAEPSPDELKERWTKWQEGASLAIVEELMTNGRLELANKLKPVITNETLRIEDKGAPLYSIPNHLNMLCFTNHKNSVRLEEGDRRWLILFSPAEPRDAAYYRRLWAFIEGRDGPAAWKHRLERHVIAMDPKDRAPMTAAKEEMREASMTDVESAVAEWVASRTGPMRDELFRFEDAWSALDRSSRPHKASLKLALRAAGCVQHTRQTNPSLPAVVLWSVSDHDRWVKAGAAERTRAWMDMQGYETKVQFDDMN